MKSIDEYFPGVLFIIRHKVVRTLKSIELPYSVCRYWSVTIQVKG